MFLHNRDNLASECEVVGDRTLEGEQFLQCLAETVHPVARVVGCSGVGAEQGSVAF